MSESKKIFELIPKVMKEIGAIGKNGVNEYDKYKFRSIDDVYNKLSPVLGTNGVFFVPTVIDSNEEKTKSSKGNDQVRVKLRVKYTIFAADGSFIESVVEGEAVDRSDKATNKALTAAFKYMAIQVFCIAIEGMDDADKESPELSFVREAPPATEKKSATSAGEKKSEKKGFSNIKIPSGKFKGKKISEIPENELRDYVIEIEQTLKESGKKEPGWFSEMRAAANL